MNSEALKLIGNIVYNICTEAVAFIFIIMYFHTFFEKKKRTLLIWVIEGVYFLSSILLVTVLSAWPPWAKLLFNIITTIFLSFSVVGSLSRRIVFSVIFQTIYLLTETLTALFFIMIHVDWAAQDIAGSIISKILMLILMKVLQCFFSHEDVRDLPWKYNATMMSLPIGSMIITYYMFWLNILADDVRYIYVSFVMFFVLMLVNAMMFRIYRKLFDNLELKRKNAIYQLEIDLYVTHIKEKESAMMDLRQTRHDLKHQIIYLLELSEKKEYAQLEDYLKHLAEWEPLEGLMIARTDNFMIDALVNYKYSLAKKCGIDFRAKMELPTSLPFEDADLCIILGNALDNAIEAGLRGDVPTPYVDLKMKYDGGNLMAIIENSFDGKIKRDIHGKILTRKQEFENHGIGMDSMRKVAEKYHGFFDIEYDDKKFCLKMILYWDE